MQIRRFSADLKTKIPGGHPGLYGVPIQLDSAHLFTQNMEELALRLNGLPILLNRPMIVVSMYLEPHASMQYCGLPNSIIPYGLRMKNCRPS